MDKARHRERRRESRIRFHSTATVADGQREVTASTADISSRGLFLFVDQSFREASEIDVVLMLPEDLNLPLAGMVCCHGSVVRVEPSGGGKYGVAVRIDRMMPTAQV